MEKLLNGEIIKYCIIVMTMLGVAFKVVQTIIYINLMEQSENVPASKNKLIKQMKLKFENCFKLNLGVNNIEAFVDKYMYKHRICGISIYSFNRIPIVAAWLSGVTGIACGCICYLENYSVKMGSVYEIYGIGAIMVLKLAEVILDTTHKKNILYINLIDFFENSLVNHLSHDTVNANAITEEEREMLEEITTVPKTKKLNESKEKILYYTKKEKGKKTDNEKIQNSNAEAIIKDVISEFLT
ncbi:MAG: hypothetical protein ACERKZ_08890 [Lachnotalea sp.]